MMEEGVSLEELINLLSINTDVITNTEWTCSFDVRGARKRRTLDFTLGT